MKVRPAASGISLREAMNQGFEVNTMEELKDHIRKDYGNYFIIDTVTIKPHNCDGSDKPSYDDRNGWNTYLVTADTKDGYKAQAVYFTNGTF